ncbi:MAG: radical SAM protein [Candidatus Daviesbacteria bacterium]
MAERDISSRLRSGVFLVEGAKRAALYDTTNSNIYSLNQEAAQVMKGENTDPEFWLKLTSMRLALTRQDFATEPVTPEVEIPKPSLQFAWLEITDQCNERCLHCYGSFSPDKKEKVAKPFGHTEWEGVIQSLAEIGCQQIQFIGGESFRYRGETKTQTVLDLAEFAKEQNFSFIEIFTNGTLISAEAVKRIKDLRVSIALSIYSSNAAVHDSITQTPESYRRTLRAINILREAGVPVRAAIIVMKQNEDTIKQTLEMAQNLGLNIKTPDVVRPSGRAQETDITPSVKTLIKYGLITKPNFSTDPVSFRRNHIYHNCLAGKIAVTTDGQIIPCIFSRNDILGSLKDQELTDVLESPTLREMWELTKDKVLVCKDCEYRYACFDCRPLAEGSSCGKNYSNVPYPRCTYNPYTGEWGSGIWKMDNQGEIIYEELPIQN